MSQSRTLLANWMAVAASQQLLASMMRPMSGPAYWLTDHARASDIASRILPALGSRLALDYARAMQVRDKIIDP
jgi:hypothetical protein